MKLGQKNFGSRRVGGEEGATMWTTNINEIRRWIFCEHPKCTAPCNFFSSESKTFQFLTEILEFWKNPDLKTRTLPLWPNNSGSVFINKSKQNILDSCIKFSETSNDFLPVIQITLFGRPT